MNQNVDFCDKIMYPSFKKEDIKENIHGFEISDPYRWLEDPHSNDTKLFVQKQNEITEPYLNKCKYKNQIKDKLTEIWNFPNYGCIRKHGDYFYYSYNTGLQNQSVLYRMKTLDSTPEEFLDPNKWSDDGTVSMSISSFSNDGKLFAFGQSSSGHDWIIVKFMNTETMAILPDELRQIKFSSVEWTHDNKGVFYSGYLEQEGNTDGTETTVNINHKLRYHVLGTDQSSDFLCHEILDQPKWLLSSEISDCGRYVILYVHQSCDPNSLLSICDLAESNYVVTNYLNFKPVVKEFEAKYNYVTNEGTRFLFKTNKSAPMAKIVQFDIGDLNNIVWKDLISTQKDVLINWASCADKNKLVVCFQKDVADSIAIHCMKTGEKLCNLNFPLGTISGFFSKWNQSMIFIKFSSFFVPGINYSYDLSLGSKTELKVLQTTQVKGIDLGNFQVEQVFYKSKDGVDIPMFIMHHKDFVRDGNNPCRLYGYGGFDISIKPSFGVSFLLLMQNFRFVCAIANIRGGGEYGEPWHNQGRLQFKQNCFDDFIKASEYLISERYTKAEKLTIEGGSNGGLLVAACMNQRPDLFGAIVGHVGVLDMLRFHKFTIGHAWVSDFGDPDIPEQFEWIIKYSPLHNIKPHTSYPACLLLTADHDDRVVPLHTMKFIAQLQETVGEATKKPLLVRIDVKAGHGAGKPTMKKIEECKDVICFLQLVLDLEWFD